MECVTVNFIWKILHSRWTVVLGLNGVCYSEHYMEDTLEKVDSCIAASMECVTVNIILKIIHSRWTVELWLELIMLQ